MTHVAQLPKPPDHTAAIIRSPAGDYRTTWLSPRSFLPRNSSQARMQETALKAQLQHLLDRGPIQVPLGEPLQVFAITNQDGEIYRGFLELAAGTDHSPNGRDKIRSPPITPPSKGSVTTASSPSLAGIDPATGLPRTAGDGNSGLPRVEPLTGLPAAAPAKAGPAIVKVPEDPVAEARKLTASGKYEEALQRYLSMYESSRTSPARLPFAVALEDWVALGEEYPKARQALVEIRDRDKRAFAQGEGSAELFKELVWINSAVQEDKNTCVLFKALWQNDPSLARDCYLFAEEVLVRRGEYELCVGCLGDVQVRFDALQTTFRAEQRILHYSSNRRFTAPHPGPADPRAQVSQSSNDRFVGQICRWVEILVATGGKSDAERLRDRALAVLDDPRLDSAVNDAEKRVMQVRASASTAKNEDSRIEGLVPAQTPVNLAISERSASIEHWKPSVAPGAKPDLEGTRNEARTLASAREYEQALQRHLWYHNHALEHDPNERGVRLSFVLHDWVSLGQKYPKAKQALLEIRDWDSRKLMEGEGSIQQFRDVVAINKQYGSEEATYALYKSIRERNPTLAAQCYDSVEDLLVNKGDYEICIEDMGSRQQKFSAYLQEWERGRKHEDRIRNMMKNIPPASGRPSFVPPPFYDKQFVERTRRLIEILVGTGRNAEALEIWKKAVDVLDDPRLVSAVADAAKRTGKPVDL